MQPRPHSVEQAASFLKNGAATPKEKLVIGSKFFWGAMLFSEDWTPQLLERARMAYMVLCEHGTVERTLREMDDDAIGRCLKQFTKDVTQLATDIEQARSQQPRTRKS